MQKILLFGDGNFLRAFAGEYIENANEKSGNIKAYICQPRTNTKVIDALKEQNCKYDVIFRGRLGGKVIDERKTVTSFEGAIDTVGEYNKLTELFCDNDLQIVISNTTEAGICFNEKDRIENSPAVSFPAKMTALLYERYKSGVGDIVFLPVELIENNGSALKGCILKYVDLWGLEAEFKEYVKGKCYFCNTLVDRIVTGHTEGDEDKCSVTCEPYRSWIIEADSYAKDTIPFDGIDYTDSIEIFRKRKVRILNGIHTMSVPAAYMAGFDIVRDVVNDKLFNDFIKCGTAEIEKTLPFSCSDFTDSVIERFNNPFIDHKLLDIALNSVSKFRERCLYTLLDYIEIEKTIPAALAFSFAALIAFYNKENEREYELRDSEDIIDFFENKPDVHAVLSNTAFWGRNLTEVDGLESAVEKYYALIKSKGVKAAIEEVIYE